MLMLNSKYLNKFNIIINWQLLTIGLVYFITNLMIHI